MTLPGYLTTDRSSFREVTVHGVSARLSAEAVDLPSETTSQLQLRDATEAAHVSSTTINRSAAGMRVWNISGQPGTTYSIHMTLSTAVRERVTSRFEQLYLGSFWVEARTLESAGRFSGVSLYDGPSRIASFNGLGRRQLRRADEFRLDEIVPISNGLDVVVRLETPLGTLTAYEISGVGALLVKDERVFAENGSAEVATG